MGVLIGLIIGLILATLPAVLIAFSKKVSGTKKVIFVCGVLAIPYLLKIAANVFVVKAQGNSLPYGLGPVIPMTWYVSAWALYSYFVIKYGSPKGKRIAKWASITISIIILASIFHLAKNAYMQNESETIVDCGSEKIFTKNRDPNKLYITASYIRTKPSFYIGDLEGNSIILSREHKNIRSINDCLQYSKNLNLIYPEGSKHNKEWLWEKQTEEVSSTLAFNSTEELCSNEENDKREDYDYRMWQKQNQGNKVKTNQDSFIFETDGKVHTTKAETIEFSQHFLGSTFSTSNFNYIIRPSITSSSKIVLWKFTKNGEFLKETHIVLPNGMILEQGKSHPISHVEISKSKIQFRLYTIYQGNKEQKWRNVCRYSVLEIKNKN